MGIGAFEKGVAARDEDFSIRAQVRYTSKRRRRIPRRIIDGYIEDQRQQKKGGASSIP